MRISSLFVALAATGTMAQTTTCTAIKPTITAHAVLPASTSKLSNSTLATSTRPLSAVYLGTLLSSQSASASSHSTVSSRLSSSSSSRFTSTSYSPSTFPTVKVVNGTTATVATPGKPATTTTTRAASSSKAANSSAAASATAKLASGAGVVEMGKYVVGFAGLSGVLALFL
ncbi:hypothetical protein DL98DRAFT_515179 [Cadophora sp. DSE1049]|nr:hypothetical protein DL98DRAFT_515179 [Cadophora sp. DSE1049]